MISKFILLFFLSKTSRLIETGFSKEGLWNQKMIFYSNEPCQWAKMAAISIYGKNP